MFGGGHLHETSRVLLNDGNKMPVLGLGTFSPEIVSAKLLPTNSQMGSIDEATGTLDPTILKSVEEATKTALDIGYRHVDSAYGYLIEESLGKVFREKFLDCTLKREDLFYTSKLWNTFHQPHRVRLALERSLHSLQLDYIDLYLIHHPITFQPGEDLMSVDENGAVAFDNVDLCQTWEVLEQCKDAGLVKSIGVSNFNRELLEMILNKPGLKYKPVCNQVEFHPYLTQKGLQEFCRSKDIVLVGYGVLGSPGAGNWKDQGVPSILQNPMLISIGKKYQKSPAQVSIRYTMQRGVVPIVKSFSPERLRQNFQVFDFHLSPEDMKEIDGLNQNLRYWKYEVWKDHPNYHYQNFD
ncbi:aldo-keto reductase family 1 member C3-like isoform X2 [Engystomops pustulosus]|uniref:aldo-keto reductase family 1 member C3-like isoform X2 n=1 Tax=Engystomops pustulosus TaxID=76066 RepID=UPI003AFA7DF7